jgi:hypothetical protein
MQTGALNYKAGDFENAGKVDCDMVSRCVQMQRRVESFVAREIERQGVDVAAVLVVSSQFGRLR